jgi:hypothetical protein
MHVIKLCWKKNNPINPFCLWVVTVHNIFCNHPIANVCFDGCNVVKPLVNLFGENHKNQEKWVEVV